MSKLIWAIVIIIVLVVGGFLLFGGDDEIEEGESTPKVVVIESGYSDLDTSDQVFGEMDSAVDFIE